MAASRSDGPVLWWAVLAYDPLPIGGIAVALLLGTSALLRISPSLPLLVAGFCGAALVYGADRALVPSPEDATNHPERRRWVRAHRSWLMAEAGLLLVAGGGALAFLQTETLLASVGLAGLAALHLLPVGPWGRPLKSLGLGKPFIVAGAWAIGGTLLPVFEAGQIPHAETWGLVVYRMLFILPNVLMADWGDRHGDRAAGVRPWPDEHTGGPLRWLATGLLGLAAGGAIVGSMGASTPLLLWVDALGPLLLLGAVWAVSPSRPDGRLIMDGLVAWPLVTAAVAWGIGVFG